jgi:cell wall-associated NlpC family hydrolase
MDTREIIEAYIKESFYKPYIYGGDDFVGLDCSGIVQELLRAVGVWPTGVSDLNAQGIWDYYKKLPARPISFGTLLFWGPSQSEVSHVAWALNGTHYVGAEGGRSTTTTVEQAAKDNAFIKPRPIAYRGKPVALAFPPYPWEY